MHSYLQGHPALIHAIKRLERMNPDQFEIYYEHRTSTKIDSKDQEIDTLSRSEDVGLSIRLIKDRKLGFSFTTSLENDAIEKAVDTALDIASFMPEDQNTQLYSFGSAVYPSVDNFDTQGLDLPFSNKTKLAKALEAQCKKADSRIKAVRAASANTCVPPR